MAEENVVERKPEAQVEQQPEFQIHKLYVKDISFQVPNGVKAFQKDWAPELNVEVKTESKSLEEANTHEVSLGVKCTVSSDKNTAFTCEVVQAGIFTLTNMQEEQTKHALGAYCPGILYPYLRAVMSDIVTRGGFPQLSLAPINFDLLYEEQQKTKK